MYIPSDQKEAISREETDTQTLSLGKDGIFYCVLKQDSDVTLEEARKVVAKMKEMNGGLARPTLVDIRSIRSISREARAFFAGVENAEVQKAAALIVSSSISRIVGNFFIGLNKPIVPTKLFTSEVDALNWLKDYFK